MMWRKSEIISFEPLNSEKLKEAIELFKNGDGYTNIGKKFKTSYSVIGRQLKALGYSRTRTEAMAARRTCKPKGKHDLKR